MKRRNNIQKDTGKKSTKRFCAKSKLVTATIPSITAIPELPKEIWCDVIAPKLKADDVISLWLTCSTFKGSEYLSKRLKVLNNFYYTKKGSLARCRSNLASRIRKEDNAEMFLLYHKKFDGNPMYPKLCCPCSPLVKQGCINILKMIERKNLTFAQKQPYQGCGHFTWSGTPNRLIDGKLVVDAIRSNNLDIATWLIDELKHPISYSQIYLDVCKTGNALLLLWLLNRPLETPEPKLDVISACIEECIFQSKLLKSKLVTQPSISLPNDCVEVRLSQYEEIVKMLKIMLEETKDPVKSNDP